MHEVTPDSESVAALPLAVLAKILQHLPQQQRLRHCALVSTAWAPAAALATVHVEQEIHILQAHTAPALSRWLQQHGGHVLSLKVSTTGWGQVVLQLPLDKMTKLQHLKLEGFRVQLTTAEHSQSSRLGVSSMDISLRAQSTASRLRHLELHRVQFDSINSLLRLASAPGLVTLKLAPVTFTGLSTPDGNGRTVSFNTEADAQQVAAALPGLLQQLPQLTVLELPGFPYTDAAVQQLSAMQDLQHVEVGQAWQIPFGNLRHLPSSVTHLKVDGWFGSICLPPDLSQLSGLLHLDVASVGVYSSAFESCRQLQVLRLDACSLLPERPGAELYNSDGTAALLRVLQTMTHLQDLRLVLGNLDTLMTAQNHFAALTASSHLTRLDVTRDRVLALQEGAVQHMFPPGRQMQRLQHLSISTDVTDENDPDPWCIDSDGLFQIIDCCPRLQHLDVCSSIKPGADLSPLLRLRNSLSQLLVGGTAFTDAAVPVILQLTNLDYLSWSWSPGFTDAGLEQLVGLDLGNLMAYSCSLSDDINPEDEGAVDLEWSPSLGSVSQQLKAMFKQAREREVQQLRRQLESAAVREQLLHSDIADLQSDISDLQSENADLRELAAAQAQEIASLQQQLDAARAGQQQ